MADLVKDAVEKQWQLKRRMEIFHRNSGSKYAPFSIEHMPYERQRLHGTGMTDEDRRLRKQWLKDQILSHDEPKEIPELQPKNVFRRFFGKPWELLFRATTPIFGRNLSQAMRWGIPKVAMAAVIFHIGLYHLTYNQRTWESISGWEVLQSKPVNMYGVMATAKTHPDYCDNGFKDRKVFVDEIKTSAVS